MPRLRSTSQYQCSQCHRSFKTSGGRTRHVNAKHRPPTPPLIDEPTPEFRYQRHPHLSARPCDVNGVFLPDGSSPPPPPTPPPAHSPAAWAPFEDRQSFDFAYFHFIECQSSKGKINRALDLWAAAVLAHNDEPQWRSADELYKTIDEIQHGTAPFKTVQLRYNGPLPETGPPPQWMTQTYELCFRDSRELLKQQLASPAFKNNVTAVPYRQFNGRRKRVWSNLMSADWAWKQADDIAKNPATHGCMFVPVVSGSDKTTVSVATGHQEYHPVYQSPGIITNTARRAHGEGVMPNALLPIPKTSKKHRSSPAFQKFCRQLYHACLAYIYEPLKSGMSTPEVVRCWDGHYRKVIYGLGPYIADYPEQVWLAAIVQGWCPKCTARPENLDSEDARRRTQAKDDFLIQSFDPGILWDDYGIRCDVVPFTHDFP
ncbi:hypothetical protein VNI00_008899 [Paramarasmius palmivorus]|uniref:C2H2-type domain-containing protein n=1 Tax=Paramarasmius palmivorus TaxID=297713 RepID=A0AAW0CSI8_9AGAR